MFNPTRKKRNNGWDLFLAVSVSVRALSGRPGRSSQTHGARSSFAFLLSRFSSSGYSILHTLELLLIGYCILWSCCFLLGCLLDTAYFATTASYSVATRAYWIPYTLYCSSNAHLLTYHNVCQMSMGRVYAVCFEVLTVQLLTFLAPEHGLHCTLYSFHLYAYLLLHCLT